MGTEVFLAYVSYKLGRQRWGMPIEYDYWDFARHWEAYNKWENLT
jgi:hypothetical protein